MMKKWLTIDNLKFMIHLGMMIIAMTLAWAAINTDVSLIKKDIEVINTNHLVHLQADINEIKEVDKEQTKLLQEILVLINSTH
jgi:hypothetical protein